MMMSHITCRHQHSAAVYIKKSWYLINFRIPATALHSTAPTTMHPHYSTAHTTMQPNYSTEFHCTALPQLHCTASSLPSTVTSQLNKFQCTALQLHCTSMHCTHYTEPPLIHCTSLHCNPTTLQNVAALYPTVQLHFTL